MTSEEFENLVAEVGLSSVPEKFRARIENVAILVEDDVPEELRREEGLSGDETLLGYYHGIPQTARGEYYGVGVTLPDTIQLFRLPILEAAEETDKSVRRVIEETIWHEVAHHFGLDDDEIYRREHNHEP